MNFWEFLDRHTDSIMFLLGVIALIGFITVLLINR